MAKAKVLVLTGYGINCEEETRYAFEQAGGEAGICHINDIVDRPRMLLDIQIFCFPGGFSYGDDTGSGKAMANKIRNNFYQEFREFAGRDTLTLGICNGFQVMTSLGLVPALDGSMGEVEAALEYNSSNRYQCRWVHLAADRECPAVFTRGMDRIRIPVAHGEGRFYAKPDVLKSLEEKNLVALRYTLPDGSAADGRFPFNPNGALNDIAAVCDPTGRLMGMMPHPERNILFTHGDDWTRRREIARRYGEELPAEGPGMAIFRNAVDYFK